VALRSRSLIGERSADGLRGQRSEQDTRRSGGAIAGGRKSERAGVGQGEVLADPAARDGQRRSLDNGGRARDEGKPRRSILSLVSIVESIGTKVEPFTGAASIRNVTRRR